MYAPSYQFGPGNTAATFNPNGPHPHPHPQAQNTPHQQPQMYNPQQYPPPTSHQSPYAPSGPGSSLGLNVNVGNPPSIMQQQGGLAHGGSGVSPYQTPYTSSPYGANIPTSASVSHPQNHIPTTSNTPPFPMSAPNMLPHQQQHQLQRMQPPSSTPTPTSASSRTSPYGSMNFPQNTPPSSTSAQFAIPQNPNNQAHPPIPNPNQQIQGGMSLTPQTSNFPPGAQPAPNPGSNLSTPLSPGSEVREKERVSLLLEINKELLLEVMRLQAVQAEAKKEEATSTEATGDGESADKEKPERPAIGKDYLECMRRLQVNLAYLAAIADRSHKPASQVPAHPAVMSAPTLTFKSSSLKSSAPTNSLATELKKEDAENNLPMEINEDRAEVLKDQYKRLQALFPGVDPKKDQSVNAAARAQAQHAAQAQTQKRQNQSQAQISDQSQNPGHAQIQVQSQPQSQQSQQMNPQQYHQQQQQQSQQKLQEMMRQKMMAQAQKSQEQQMQQQMGQGMAGLGQQGQGQIQQNR